MHAINRLIVITTLEAKLKFILTQGSGQLHCPVTFNKIPISKENILLEILTQTRLSDINRNSPLPLPQAQIIIGLLHPLHLFLQVKLIQ